MAILESEICGHGREVVSGCNLCDGLKRSPKVRASG